MRTLAVIVLFLSLRAAFLTADTDAVNDSTPATTNADSAGSTVGSTPARREAVPLTMPQHHRYKPSGGYSWHHDLSDRAGQYYDKMHEWLGDRLHVGIRSTSYDFVDDLSRIGQGEENYFVGTIDEMQDIQDESWGNITLGIYLNRNLGLEYHRDEVRARAFTDSEDNHSDGDFVVDGNVFSVVARLPLDQVLHGIHYVFEWPRHDQGWEYDLLARFVPYVGIGLGNLDASFEAETWWAHGYASPESWEELGSPPDTIRNDHVREMQVSGDTGRYERHGLSVRLVDNLYFDMNWSSVEVTLAVDYYLDGEYRASGTIPMDYESKNVGIRYFF